MVLNTLKCNHLTPLPFKKLMPVIRSHRVTNKPIRMIRRSLVVGDVVILDTNEELAEVNRTAFICLVGWTLSRGVRISDRIMDADQKRFEKRFRLDVRK